MKRSNNDRVWCWHVAFNKTAMCIVLEDKSDCPNTQKKTASNHMGVEQ